MAEFEPAFSFMLPHEGGYVCDPNDPGGETRYGISQRTHPNLDIGNLSLDDARAIYKQEFWDGVGYDQLTSQLIANKLFDLSVNMGSHEAVQLLQQACCDCAEPVAADGHLGPLTIAAANHAQEAQLLDSFRDRAEQFYRKLADRRPGLAKFLNGWIARARA